MCNPIRMKLNAPTRALALGVILGVALVDALWVSVYTTVPDADPCKILILIPTLLFCTNLPLAFLTIA